MIQVLIVDESVLERRLIKKALEEDPEIGVASTAPNGLIALRKVDQLDPDLILLDINLPDMDGIDALRIMKNMRPKTPIIVFTAHNENAAASTIQALELGAADFIEKPSGARDFEESKSLIARSLVPKIKAIHHQIQTPHIRIPAVQKGFESLRPRSNTHIKPKHIDCVAIGVSTGGPDALVKIFPSFPADFPIPIVIVQHMPPLFTKNLADRLDTISELDVKECRPGDVLYKGGAWVAAGGFHMTVRKAMGQVIISTSKDTPEVGCRPSVNVLFRSVARAFGANVLAVMLTGMGKDGLEGSRHIVDAGGTLIAQDEASSVVWGMPGAVARAGLTDTLIPLARMGDEIVQRTARNTRSYTYQPEYNEAARF
ncbi:MAG: chemotaxis response regulator protein-glutamate methylesterase [Bacteroidota bacterium]